MTENRKSDTYGGSAGSDKSAQTGSFVRVFVYGIHKVLLDVSEDSNQNLDLFSGGSRGVSFF